MFTLNQLVTKLKCGTLKFPLKVIWLSFFNDQDIEKTFIGFQTSWNGDIIGLHLKDGGWHGFSEHDKYIVKIKHNECYLPPWF